MGLRFRKRFGFGLFKFNLSLGGVSLSAGVPGATANIPLIGRRRKPMVTVGLPGTGFSYQQNIDVAGKSRTSTHTEITAFLQEVNGGVAGKTEDVSEWQKQAAAKQAPDPAVQAAWTTHVADRIAEEKAQQQAARVITLDKHGSGQ